MQTATHALADLVDLARLQRMCNSFAAAGDIGLAVLDPAGNVLVSAGWQDICMGFHRVHEDTLKGCVESDARIDQRLADGRGSPKPYAYQCANGLWDVAFPLIIAGTHLGNVFTGQFFYDDDAVDVAAFRERALRLGFDEAGYMEALARVPVLSHERVAQTISFLADFVAMLGELGLAALRQEQEREALRESEAKYRDVVERASDGIAILQEGLVVFANEALARMSGYSAHELTGASFLVVVQGKQHAEIAERVRRRIAGEDVPTGYELDLVRKDGTPFIVEVRADVVTYEGAPAELVLLRDVTERRRADAALRESEERYRSLFEDNHAVMLLIDPESGAIVDANPAACAWYGWTREEMRALRIEQINTLSESEVRAEMAAARAKRRQVFHFKHRHADGTVRDVEVYSGPIEVQGRTLLYSLIHDVSERTRLETALRQSEAEYRRIVETAVEGIIVLDTHARMTLVNRQMAARLGYSIEEMVGQQFEAFLAEEERADHHEQMAMRARGEGAVYERCFRRRDGGESWALISATTIVDPEGRMEGSFATLTDITERRQMETALRESEERFRAIAEYAASWEAWFSPQGKLLWMNRYSVDLTGFTPEEYMAAEDYLSMVIAEEDIAMVAEQFQGALQGSSGDNLEIRIPRKDGSRLWASVSWRPILHTNGASLGFRTSTQDISARKRAEEALAHLNAELAAEAAVLAAANATITRIAATDDLTGLANRRHFYESLETAVSLARRHGSPLALVSFDLDGLKRVNDSAGHEAGDEVLTGFAALLAALRRAEDLPARLGGDEFSVLLPGMELDGAHGLAERVLAAVRSCAALEQPGVTVSAGVAQWMPGELPDDLLRRADEALYDAKRGGGDAVAGGA